jgi:hypothetical protein
MNNDTITNAIAYNIAALGELLDTAQLRVSEASKAIAEGEQNQAIGTMIDIDQMLENALALYRAAIALYRAGRTS